MKISIYCHFSFYRPKVSFYLLRLSQILITIELSSFTIQKKFPIKRTVNDRQAPQIQQRNFQCNLKKNYSFYQNHSFKLVFELPILN